MPHPENMWEDNVLQRLVPEFPVFYVDKECILCAVCAGVAPDNFRTSDDEDHNIVYKQPETPKELDQCRDALENCPVEAIGDDA